MMDRAENEMPREHTSEATMQQGISPDPMAGAMSTTALPPLARSTVLYEWCRSCQGRKEARGYKSGWKDDQAQGGGLHSVIYHASRRPKTIEYVGHSPPVRSRPRSPLGRCHGPAMHARLIIFVIWMVPRDAIEPCIQVQHIRVCPGVVTGPLNDGVGVSLNSCGVVTCDRAG